MNNKKYLSLLLVFILCLTFVTGCNENKVSNAKDEKEVEAKVEEKKEQDVEEKNGIKEGGTFVVSMNGEPGTYNPCATADDAAYLINQNIFNKLLKINGKDEVVSDLAESWEYTDDGKTLTFKLHENVKWHDGENFSAEDVKWTFDTIKSESGFASNSLKDVKEINVIDENTIEFKLEEANSGLLGYIAWMGTYIMPKHIYEGTDWLTNEANQSPIGTGPFKFVEHVKGESITIEKNEDFYKDKAHLDKIIFKIIPDVDTAYQAWINGETDEIRGGVPVEEVKKLAGNTEYVLEEKTWPNKSYVLFNMEEGNFAKKEVREAVLYGIDPEEIFVKALKEQGSISEYFIAPSYEWALNEEVKSPKRDIEKAQQLLEEAGYKKDENGYYFETSIDTFPGWDNVVAVLKSNFDEIGIKLNHNSMDDAAYDAKILDDKNFELTVLGGYQGPDISSITSRFSTEGPMNYGLYSSEEMDTALKNGNIATELEDRAVYYKEVQEILRNDLPVVFFADKGSVIPIKSYVKGHPASEAKENSSEAEFSHIWLDK